MNTDKAICLKNETFEDSDGKKASLVRGKEYTISLPNEDGNVTVFTNYWFEVPKEYFGGNVQFTREEVKG